MTATAVPRTRTRDDTVVARLAVTLREYGPGVGAAAVRVLGRLRRLLLTVAALVCLIAAAWMVAVPLGLAVAGVSLLWLEYLTTPEASAEGEP